MAKFVTYTITILLLFTVNVFFPHLRGAVPNFLFLLIIFYSMRKEGIDFLWLAFFSGLLLDTFGNNFFGMYALSFLIIGLLINYATQTMFSSDPSLPLVASIVVVSNILLIGLIIIGNAVGFRLHLVDHDISALFLKEKVWLDLTLNLIFAIPIYLLTVLNDRIIIKYQRQRHG